MNSEGKLTALGRKHWQDTTHSNGRHYTEEIKTEAARLAQSVGQHEAARRLGVPVATLGKRTRQQRTLEATFVDNAMPATPVKRPASEMEAEITRLRKELASVKLDIEIL